MDERKVLIVFAVIVAVMIIAILGDICLNNGLAEEGVYFILCRPGSVVNVRNRPDKAASVTAWVECGQQIKTDGKERNGYVHFVGLASEEPDGWICEGYIVDEQPRIETYRAEVYDGNVIARKWVAGKRLRVLREGQIVTVYAQTHMWAVTSKGFVMCDWLKEVE